MKLSGVHDKWFKEVLRDNGIEISDNPSSTELLMIENEYNVRVNVLPFALQVYIGGELAAEYVSDELEYI